MKTPSDVLAKTGIIKTEVRIRVMEFFIQHPFSALTIKQIVSYLSTNYPSINPTSIILTLLLFQIKGIIRSIDPETNTTQNSEPQSRFLLNKDLIE